jgi:hypothetical protein
VPLLLINLFEYKYEKDCEAAAEIPNNIAASISIPV